MYTHTYLHTYTHTHQLWPRPLLGLRTIASLIFSGGSCTEPGLRTESLHTETLRGKASAGFPSVFRDHIPSRQDEALSARGTHKHLLDPLKSSAWGHLGA